MEQREWVDKAADRVLPQPRFTLLLEAMQHIDLRMCRRISSFYLLHFGGYLNLAFISLSHLHFVSSPTFCW